MSNLLRTFCVRSLVDKASNANLLLVVIVCFTVITIFTLRNFRGTYNQVIRGQGARYNTITSHGSFALVLDTDGRKKVSGTVGRPIIDIVGRDLTKSLLRIGDDVLITYQETLITVEAL